MVIVLLKLDMTKILLGLKHTNRMMKEGLLFLEEPNYNNDLKRVERSYFYSPRVYSKAFSTPNNTKIPKILLKDAR